MPTKLAIALSRFPLPARKGDKLRAWQQIISLSHTFDIYLVCLADEIPDEQQINTVSEYVKDLKIIYIPKWKRILPLFLSLFSHLPFQVAYFQSSEMKACLMHWFRAHDVKLCYVQLIRLGKSVPYVENVKYFLDYMDALSAGMINRVPQSSGIMRFLYAWEGRKLKQYEADISDHYHACSIITQADADAMPERIQSKIIVIPNGVEERYFIPRPAPAKRYDIVFTGNMGYFPNVKAALFLVSDILPLLNHSFPNLKVCIAGTDPAQTVRELASDRVTITGFVEDMADVMLQSRIYVAPLFTGSGLQNKLLESMALGLPVITTSLANNALGAKPNSEILIADTAADFAHCIQNLLEQDGILANQMGKNGASFVASRYRWKSANEKLQQALLKLCS
jgi:polysaccharide biosynthesis protein PslH